MVERKIDEVPSRTELTQYQRQFVELYEQMGTKFTETKNYYNSYNTLESIKRILENDDRVNKVYVLEKSFREMLRNEMRVQLWQYCCQSCKGTCIFDGSVQMKTIRN